MNNKNNPQITEADFLAFLDQVTDQYKPKFPELLFFHATVSFDLKKVGFFGNKEHDYDRVSAYAASFAEAAIKLRQEIGTPFSAAAALREQAAALLEKAEKLSPTTV